MPDRNPPPGPRLPPGPGIGPGPGTASGRSLPPGLDPRGRRAARRGARQAGARPGSGRPGARGAAARRAGRRTVTGVKIVAAVASLAILLGSGYAWATYQKFNSDIASGTAIGANGNATSTDVDGVDQNILLVGSDSRNGATPEELQQLATQDDGGAINTDTMIVLHVPADGSRATLISFPRDSWVDIPGYGGKARINSAYSDAYADAKQQGEGEIAAQSAGLLETSKTISELTGLTIDHYLQVDLLGFYRISNALGGVDVCLKEAQRDSYSGIDLPAGVTHDLKGTQALAFVRQRHGLDGSDFARIARQQYFLSQMFAKVSSGGTLLNPFKLNNLLGAVSSSLLKDTGFNLLSLAQQVQNLKTGNITFATIPNQGGEVIGGADVLATDPDQVKAFVQQVLANTADEIAKATTVAPSTVTVDVLNGGAATGDATYNSDLLTAAGFVAGQVGDAPSTVTATTIQYPPGMANQAKTLGQYVPGATYVTTSDVTTVTLVLGPDGLKVVDPTSSTAATTTAPPATDGSAAPNEIDGVPCIE